jgi:hypothetical protein
MGKYVESRCSLDVCEGQVGWDGEVDWQRRENRRGTDEVSCAEVMTETTFLSFADSTAGRDFSCVGRHGAK